MFSPVSAFPRSPEHPKNSWRLMCCNAILRGAEVLGFVGWNVLKEGESKNKGKGFHSFASQAARKPAEREWNSETERRTAAAPARLVHSSCGGTTGRGGGGCVPVPPHLERYLRGPQLLISPRYCGCHSRFCARQSLHPSLLNEFLPLRRATREVSRKAGPEVKAHLRA